MGWAFLEYSFAPLGLGLLSTISGHFSTGWRDLFHWTRCIGSLGQMGFAGRQQVLEYKKKALLDNMPKEFWTSEDPAVLRAGLIGIVSKDLSEADLVKYKLNLKSALLPNLDLNRRKLKNYREWADERGIADKGFAIFMSIFPNTIRPLYTKWAVEASEGVTFVLGAGLNALFRQSAGIMTAVRTGKNALL